MGKGFKAGAGGGNPLNFDVVGGTTEPTNPKENTIWVNTDQKITSWHFGADEPNYREEGTVWITSGTSSPVAFNALKKNSIQVYPLSAKQYISGALVDKTAKSYQNGKWVDWWNGRLYVTGNEFEFVTGGWVDTPKGSGDSWDTPTTTYREIKKDNNGITVSESQARYATGAVSCRTAKKVSLRGYNTLKINVTNINGTAHFKCFTIEPPWHQQKDHAAGITISTLGVHTIDVSSVDADVYIMFGVLSYSEASAHSASATFNEIWLE